MGVQEVNFQGSVPQYEKRNNTVISLLGAPIIATANYACNMLFDKSLKQDTFYKTVKACIKDHNRSYKDAAAELCKFFKQDKLANNISKIKNGDKRLAVGVFLLETLGFFGLFKIFNDMASKFRHRKD